MAQFTKKYLPVLQDTMAKICQRKTYSDTEMGLLHWRFSEYPDHYNEKEDDCQQILEYYCRYIEIILKYSESDNFQSYKAYKSNIAKYMSRIADIGSIPNVANEFVKGKTTLIFEHVTDPSIKITSAKELIRAYNGVIVQSDKSVREKIIHSGCRIYLYKLADILCTCGDYEYQTCLLETIFRICPDDFIKKYACDFFPETESLQQALVKINVKDFDNGLRMFLNIVNRVFRNVYSFVASDIMLDEIIIGPPVDSYGNKQKLWIDFNKSTDTIGIYCDQNCVRNDPFSQDTEEGGWELITIFIHDISFVEIKRPKAIKGLQEKLVLFRFTLNSPFYVQYPASEKVTVSKYLKIVTSEREVIDELQYSLLPEMFKEKFQGSRRHKKKSQIQDSSSLVTESSKSSYKPLNYRVCRRVKSLSIPSVDTRSMKSLEDLMNVKNSKTKNSSDKNIFVGVKCASSNSLVLDTSINSDNCAPETQYFSAEENLDDDSLSKNISEKQKQRVYQSRPIRDENEGDTTKTKVVEHATMDNMKVKFPFIRQGVSTRKRSFDPLFSPIYESNETNRSENYCLQKNSDNRDFVDSDNKTAENVISQKDIVYSQTVVIENLSSVEKEKKESKYQEFQKALENKIAHEHNLSQSEGKRKKESEKCCDRKQLDVNLSLKDISKECSGVKLVQNKVKIQMLQELPVNGDIIENDVIKHTSFVKDQIDEKKSNKSHLTRNLNQEKFSNIEDSSKDQQVNICMLNTTQNTFKYVETFQTSVIESDTSTGLPKNEKSEASVPQTKECITTIKLTKQEPYIIEYKHDEMQEIQVSNEKSIQGKITKYTENISGLHIPKKIISQENSENTVKQKKTQKKLRRNKENKNKQLSENRNNDNKKLECSDFNTNETAMVNNTSQAKVNELYNTEEINLIESDDASTFVDIDVANAVELNISTEKIQNTNELNVNMIHSEDLKSNFIKVAKNVDSAIIEQKQAISQSKCKKKIQLKRKRQIENTSDLTVVDMVQISQSKCKKKIQLKRKRQIENTSDLTVVDMVQISDKNDEDTIAQNNVRQKSSITKEVTDDSASTKINEVQKAVEIDQNDSDFSSQVISGIATFEVKQQKKIKSQTLKKSQTSIRKDECSNVNKNIFLKLNKESVGEPEKAENNKRRLDIINDRLHDDNQIRKTNEIDLNRKGKNESVGKCLNVNSEESDYEFLLKQSLLFDQLLPGSNEDRKFNKKSSTSIQQKEVTSQTINDLEKNEKDLIQEIAVANINENVISQKKLYVREGNNLSNEMLEYKSQLEIKQELKNAKETKRRRIRKKNLLSQELTTSINKSENYNKKESLQSEVQIDETELDYSIIINNEESLTMSTSQEKNCNEIKNQMMERYTSSTTENRIIKAEDAKKSYKRKKSTTEESKKLDADSQISENENLKSPGGYIKKKKCLKRCDKLQESNIIKSGNTGSQRIDEKQIYSQSEEKIQPNENLKLILKENENFKQTVFQQQIHDDKKKYSTIEKINLDVESQKQDMTETKSRRSERITNKEQLLEIRRNDDRIESHFSIEENNNQGISHTQKEDYLVNEAILLTDHSEKLQLHFDTLQINNCQNNLDDKKSEKVESDINENQEVNFEKNNHKNESKQQSKNEKNTKTLIPKITKELQVRIIKMKIENIDLMKNSAVEKEDSFRNKLLVSETTNTLTSTKMNKEDITYLSQETYNNQVKKIQKNENKISDIGTKLTNNEDIVTNIFDINTEIVISSSQKSKNSSTKHKLSQSDTKLFTNNVKRKRLYDPNDLTYLEDMCIEYSINNSIIEERVKSHPSNLQCLTKSKLAEVNVDLKKGKTFQKRQTNLKRPRKIQNQNRSLKKVMENQNNDSKIQKKKLRSYKSNLVKEIKKDKSSSSSSEDEVKHFQVVALIHSNPDDKDKDINNKPTMENSKKLENILKNKTNLDKITRVTEKTSAGQTIVENKRRRRKKDIDTNDCTIYNPDTSNRMSSGQKKLFETFITSFINDVSGTKEIDVSPKLNYKTKPKIKKITKKKENKQTKYFDDSSSDSLTIETQQNRKVNILENIILRPADNEKENFEFVKQTTLELGVASEMKPVCGNNEREDFELLKQKSVLESISGMFNGIQDTNCSEILWRALIKNTLTSLKLLVQYAPDSIKRHKEYDLISQFSHNLERIINENI